MSASVTVNINDPKYQKLRRLHPLPARPPKLLVLWVVDVHGDARARGGVGFDRFAGRTRKRHGRTRDLRAPNASVADDDVANPAPRDHSAVHELDDRLARWPDRYGRLREGPS